MSKNNHKHQEGFDFITPFVEIFTILVQHIIELLQIVLVYLVTKLIEYIKVQ